MLLLLFLLLGYFCSLTNKGVHGGTGVAKTGRAAKGHLKTGGAAKGVAKMGLNEKGAQAVIHVGRLRDAINGMTEDLMENYLGLRTGRRPNFIWITPPTLTHAGFIAWCNGDKRRCISVWNYLIRKPAMPNKDADWGWDDWAWSGGNSADPQDEEVPPTDRLSIPWNR